MLSKFILPIGHSFVVPVLAVMADTANVVSGAWSPLINLGAIGCVLAWFLIRAEPRLGRIERAIDRSTRGNLLTAQIMSDIAEDRTVSETTKQQAKDIIREIDDSKNGDK